MYVYIRNTHMYAQRKREREKTERDRTDSNPRIQLNAAIY